MRVTLLPIPLPDLHLLAQGEYPASLPNRLAEDAMPPPVVAIRALQMLTNGPANAWCNTFYMLRTQDNQVVGGCGFKHLPLDGRVEIGYGVGSAFQRQGMATAAVARLLQLAFASGQADEVLANILPDNIASAKVVQRLGFEPIGMTIDKDDGESLMQWLARKPFTA